MRSLKTTAKICLAVICSLCLVLNVAMAAGFSADAVYNSVSGKLEVSGTGSENAQVTVMVMPYTTDAASITDDVASSGNVIFNMANIDFEGNYAFEMGLKDTWGGGLYKAVIGENEAWFTYADSQKLASNLAAINGGDATALAALIASKGSDIGACTEHALKYGTDIGKYLYANRPVGGYDADGYLKAYTAGLAICMVKGGDYGLEDIIAKFGIYMDVDSSVTYSDAVIEDAERILADADLSAGTAKQICDEAIVIAQLNLAETDSVMQKIVNDNKGILNIDFNDYNQLSNDYKKLQVFAALLNTEFNSAKQFAADFKASAKNVLSTDSGPSYVGGGNGGSSSSGGGSFAGGGSVVSNTPATQPAVGYFDDMAGHWGLSAVNTLVSRGCISGYPDGTFRPENNVTRAEFAKMLALALKIPVASADSPYSDVDANDWHAPYVVTLSGRGIITGWDGKFDPDGKITRQDAAVMTYRAVKDVLSAGNAQIAFADEAQIADYAKEAVNKLSSLKIINGYDGRFEPANNTTRAQAATIICNVLTACGIN